MTLIITRVCSKGIIMAADSAEIVYFSDGTWERRNTPYKKLFYVEKANVGISIWGKSWLGPVGSIKTSKWIQKFVEDDMIKDMTIYEIASELAKRLNEVFDEFDNHVAPGRMGFHIAGFDANKVPDFYHVHNGHYKAKYLKGKYFEVSPIEEVWKSENKSPDKIRSFYIRSNKWFFPIRLNEAFDFQNQISKDQEWFVEVDDKNPPLRRFKAYHDLDQSIIPEGGLTTWNGDFALLFEFFRGVVEDNSSIQNVITGILTTGFLIPSEYSSEIIQHVKTLYNPMSLSQAAESLRSLIKIIEKIYFLNRRLQTIGSPISILTLTEKGIENNTVR
jgi:hypothetical protein